MLKCFGLFTTRCTVLKHPGEILLQYTLTGNTLPLAVEHLGQIVCLVYIVRLHSQK